MGKSQVRFFWPTPLAAACMSCHDLGSSYRGLVSMGLEGIFPFFPFFFVCFSFFLFLFFFASLCFPLLFSVFFIIVCFSSLSSLVAVHKSRQLQSTQKMGNFTPTPSTPTPFETSRIILQLTMQATSTCATSLQGPVRSHSGTLALKADNPPPRNQPFEKNQTLDRKT